MQNYEKQKPFDPDNRNTYKTNANPKINILMSENIGQRRPSSLPDILRHEGVYLLIRIYFIYEKQIQINLQ